MLEVMFLFFGIGLTATGFGFLVFGVLALVRNSYKPRFTRSTYLPPKR
jgi:hypothetical protein